MNIFLTLHTTICHTTKYGVDIKISEKVSFLIGIFIDIIFINTELVFVLLVFSIEIIFSFPKNIQKISCKKLLDIHSGLTLNYFIFLKHEQSNYYRSKKRNSS